MAEIYNKQDNAAGFYKIPKELTHYVDHKDYKTEMSMLYGIIVQLYNVEMGYAYPSISKLALLYGKGERTTGNQLAKLEKIGLIKRFRGQQGNYCYIPLKPLSKAEFFKKYPDAFENYKTRIQKADEERERSMNNLRRHRKSQNK